MFLTKRENYYVFFLSCLWIALLTSANGGVGTYILAFLVIILAISSIINKMHSGLDQNELILLFVGGVYFVKFPLDVLFYAELNSQLIVDMATFYSFFFLTFVLYSSLQYFRIDLFRKAIGLVIIILAIDGFIEFFYGFSILRNGARDNIRVHSIFEKNHYGSYMFFMYILYSILSFKATGLPLARNTVFIFVLVLLSEFIALSRLPLLLTAILFSIQALYFLIKTNVKNRALLFIIPFVISLGVSFLMDYTKGGVYGSQFDNYMSVENIQNEQKDRRFQAWSDSMEIIGLNPILGIPQGSFSEYSKTISVKSEILPHPHSILMEFILYSGIPLFILSSIVAIVLVYRSYGSYGLIMLLFVFPIVGPGSVVNASWVLILSTCLSLLITKKIRKNDQ